MSVIVTVSVSADGAKLEEWADANRDTMAAISGKAKEHGCIAHRFYSDGNGNVMVLDEWPDGESFHAFFQGSMADIGPMIAAVGGGQPTIGVWNELETHDKVGWGA